ncbi:uncharacterized protein LOC122563833 [Chiloscyllium plagiosum]|uniref:uncharacterized protein LOC122563833 n=1 Tax=Chiloscyllium plagiosum TaxID=36176 RepID=UPI001CB7CEA0|nr:uncharacterized protein LOC122563833 [Chiloscyllium plagiosum]
MALVFAGRSVRVRQHRNPGDCVRKLTVSACNLGGGSRLAAAGVFDQGAGGRRRLLLSPSVAQRPGAQSRAAAGILEPTPRRRRAAEQGSRLSQAPTALQLHRTQQTPGSDPPVAGSVTFPLERHLCSQNRELSNTDLYMMHVNGFIHRGSCLSCRVLAPHLRNHKYLQGLWSFKRSIVTNGWASALDSNGHWHFVTMVHHQCRPYGYFRDGNRYSGRNNAVPLPRASNTLYYDILKISPSATQSQIKSAYYKQSFRYHPDRNAGSEEAALRFTQINEAYSVLGSVTLRKKYDRGILTAADLRSGKKPLEKAQTSTSKQSQAWSSSDKLSSEKSMFNFDEFYKAHYGEQLAREQTQRWRRMQLRKNKESLEGRWHIQKLMEMTVTAMLIGGFFLLFSINDK